MKTQQTDPLETELQKHIGVCGRCHSHVGFVAYRHDERSDVMELWFESCGRCDAEQRKQAREALLLRVNKPVLDALEHEHLKASDPFGGAVSN